MVSIRIPTFEFSGHYYAEILEDLIQYLRDQGMSIDESPEEPFVQILRSEALGAHLNNVLLDLVANEHFLTTAKLRDSVAGLLALIDYRLRQATPATAILVQKLAQFFSATVTLIKAPSVFATRATSTATPVEFEAVEDYSSPRTDQLTRCFAYDSVGSAYTDHTASANAGAPWSPGWGAGVNNRDLIYFGHSAIGWDRLRVGVAAASVGMVGVWEYYDGDWDGGVPDSVVSIGTGLRFDLSTFLGTGNRTGTIVRVRCNETGAYEDCVVYVLAGVNTIDTTSFLGQTIPSFTASDYTVGRDWEEVPSLTDGTTSLTVAGINDVDYTVPKDASHWWAKSTVNGVEAYWLRFRVITPGTLPTLQAVTIHNGSQYLFTEVVQGRTREDNPLASSTGLASQSYTLNRFPVIDNDTLKIYVTEAGIEEEWTRVYSLTSSSPTDKHFSVTFDGDSRATVVFGDNTFGKIPAAGIDNIRAVYRTMEDQDGNVAANTIIVNRGGVPYLVSTTNPRNAAGWSAREGNTEAELEQVKILGPESIKILGKACNSTDIVTLTEAYKTPEGSKLFSRCLAREGTYGPKTVELVVVKTGGVLATVDELADLETYFNGDTILKISRIIVFNQEAVAVNFTPKTINVAATVYGGSATAVEQAIRTLLQTEAKVINADGTVGTEWLWDFGEEVPVSMIVNAIMESSPKPRKCLVTLPAADVPLLPRELPVVGTVTLTMVP